MTSSPTDAIDEALTLAAALLSEPVAPEARWCLVRWHWPEHSDKPSFCGPLSWLDREGPSDSVSSSNLGFPGGNIGVLATFESEEAAARAAGDFEHSTDHPTPLVELHFSTKVHCHWDGKSTVLYDGGLFDGARAAYLMVLGWALDRRCPHAYRCTIECRAAAAGLWMPPNRIPEETEQSQNG